ncbi:hypothetical protein [Aliamphritea spongicola]|nr:hypothetical protein [Aliamphritea spongicola]
MQQSLENTLIASTQVAAVSQSSQQLIATTQTTTLLMLLASLPVTFGVAILIILSITRPLKSLQQQLLTIETESDLTRPCLWMAGMKFRPCLPPPKATR